MISKARANAAKGQYANVEFRLGEIEHLPVADGSVDAILSNCVINLEESREYVKTWFPGSGVEKYVLSADVAARKGAPPSSRRPRRAGRGAAVGLDARTLELIAVGASVAGHCQPCLIYHVAQAAAQGAAAPEIREAMAVGHMVEKGSMAAMQEFARGALGAPPPSSTPPACCARPAPKGGKSCCG